MDPSMISVEDELVSVERDFLNNRCGAFISSDAQNAVSAELGRLRELENELLIQSRSAWDWTSEESAIWQHAMHRQSAGGDSSATPSTGATPSSSSSNQQQQQQQSANGADQLAMLFAKRDESLREVSKTVKLMSDSIRTCGDVVSNKNVGQQQQQQQTQQQQPPSRTSASSSSSSNVQQQQQHHHNNQHQQPSATQASVAAAGGGGGGSSGRQSGGGHRSSSGSKRSHHHTIG